MERKNEQKLYPLPFEITARMKPDEHVIHLFLVAFLVVMAFLPISYGIKLFLLRVMYIFFALYLLYHWLFIGILKKMRLKLTEDYIEFIDPLGEKVAKWNEIDSVEIFTQRRQTYIGLVLKEKLEKRKKSFWIDLHHALGGIFSIKIPLASFPDLDPEKVYLTMNSRISLQTAEKSAESYEMFLESHEASEREEPQIIPLMRILFKALPAAVLMGVLYGVSLYIFNVNIIIIPFLGFAWLGYIMYERGTASVNWISNFFLGLFSAGQMVVAVVTHLMLSLRIPFSIDNILQVTWEYLLLLIAKPMDQFPVFLTISLLFICGMLYGKSFRFTRALRKLRMQKKGDYYIRRKNGVIDIFLIDPADYVEMEERTMLTLTEGCLIVKDGKNVGVLFIPKKSLDEAGINIGNRGDDNVVLIDNNQYYKIDLGGTGSYKPYVYPCHLWCNLSRQVELISIQI